MNEAKRVPPALSSIQHSAFSIQPCWGRTFIEQAHASRTNPKTRLLVVPALARVSLAGSTLYYS